MTFKRSIAHALVITLMMLFVMGVRACAEGGLADLKQDRERQREAEARLELLDAMNEMAREHWRFYEMVELYVWRSVGESIIGGTS